MPRDTHPEATEAAVETFEEPVGKVSYIPYWVKSGAFKEIELTSNIGTPNRDELDRCLNSR